MTKSYQTLALKGRPLRSLTRWLIGFFSASVLAVCAVPAQASPRLGAILLPEGGVDFRVWAPGATGVGLGGTFNGWNEQPMQGEENGVWFLHSPTAQDGDQYKFRVKTVSSPEGVWKSDPRSMSVKDGNSVIANPSHFDWGDVPIPRIDPKEQVLYELHVGTFNDPAPHDGKPATLDDAAKRLDYLARLGVNVVALMPVAEFEGQYSWGYNPSHPFAVEEAYGGPDALKRFVKEAHSKGIKVQVDLVHNHYSPPLDGMWEFDGTANSYFYQGDMMWTPWGPRPNYGQEEIRRYVLENAAMWMDEYRVDGIRWDSPQNILAYDSKRDSSGAYPDAFNRDGRDVLAAINFMTSKYSDDPAIARWNTSETPGILPVASGGELGDYQVGTADESFSSHWQTGFQEELVRLLASQPTDLAAMARLVEDCSSSPGSRVIFSDNHDKAGDLNGHTRISNKMDMSDPAGWLSRKRALLALTAVMTSPGTPMIFSGQEIHMTGTFSDKTPIDWVAAAKDHKMFRAHRDLIRIRKSFPSLMTQGAGCVAVKQKADKGILVVWRQSPCGGGADASSDVVVVYNCSPSNQKTLIPFPSRGVWFAQFNSDWDIYGQGFSSVGPRLEPLAAEMTDGEITSEIEIAAYSSIVLNRFPWSKSILHEYTDNNGLPDGWEAVTGVSNPVADEDGDGISNIAEFALGVDPLRPDVIMAPGSANQWDAGRAAMTPVSLDRLEYTYQSPDGASAEFKILINGHWFGLGSQPGLLALDGNNLKVEAAPGETVKITFFPNTRGYLIEK